MGSDLMPPDSLDGLTDKEIMPWRTEFTVVESLLELNHTVQKLGLSDDLDIISQTVKKWKPDIVFNLMEDFNGESLLDQNIVSLLELLGVAYTGCNPRGLILARDKGLSKELMAHHQIPVPRFAVMPKGCRVQTPNKLSYPMFVKSLTEESSQGISQASLVNNERQLAKRVSIVHDTLGTDAIVEEYIEGREMYVGLLGNQDVEAFPVWELLIKKKAKNAPLIATAKVKWDLDYQKKWGVKSQLAKNLSSELKTYMQEISQKCYAALKLSGCARIDLRLTPQGKVYILEANPNPDLVIGEDFAEAAEHHGLDYEALIQKILDLGISQFVRFREKT